MFSKLPPQVKMLVCMAGFGSPAAIFYVISKVLFPGWSSMKAFIAMAIVMIGLSLLVSLVVWLFNRGASKRRDKLAGKLVEDSEKGPASMDVRAKVKANNAKFVQAVREMRKNLKVNVYDLPWYMVIGDSGCGKTRLINEGDLTFSAGKPEGYQLGTLDYNWWFTEDAVFIDMAGRLCNPQEDADRREWVGVLETIAKYRKGFPINGVLACVSAESLLRDSPEKQEQDANTMLERLRDLQQKLGVTFATYLVITKCDLIPGFMQFFDRTDRDATFKHQMFGWSRPGAFDERYDPDHFTKDFDAMYGRLSDWRLRRLHDDAEETELGWAYTFPEQFRELRESIDLYVHKLFPLLKNPKGIKNLVFRGVFFTSATQQGAVILDHLKDKLGADDTSSVPLLEDLYPRPRPHFVKDLLFKKVFPEHGLVFRNEDQVHKNKRLARVVQVGNVVMALLLFGLLGVSFHKFKGVVSEPTTHALESRKRAMYDGNPRASLDLAGQLGDDAARMSQGNWVLSVLGWGSAQTLAANLTTIRQRVFEEGVLRQCLMDVGQGLTVPPTAAAGTDPVKNHERALIEYTAWCASPQPGLPPREVQSDFFRRSPAPPDSFLAKTRDELLKARRGEKLDPIAQCLDFIRARVHAGTHLSKSLLIEFLGAGERITRLQQSVEGMENYYRPIARLEPGKADKELGDWLTLRTSWPAMMERYNAILQRTEGKTETDWSAEAFGTFTAEVFGDEKSVGRQLLADFEAVSTSKVHVPTLKQKIGEVQDQWGKLAAGLEAILANRTDEEVRRFEPVKAAAARLRTNLDETLVKAIAAPEGTDVSTRVDAVHKQFGHIVAVDGGTQHLVLADSARRVYAVLGQIQKYVAGAQVDLTGKSPKEWIELLRAGSKSPTTAPADLVVVPTPASPWNEPKLKAFATAVGALSHRQGRTRVLEAILKRLGELGELGWADLYTDSCEVRSGQPYALTMAACTNRTARTPAVPAPAAAAAQPKKPDDEGPAFFGGPAPAVAEKEPAPSADPARAGAGEIPAAALPDFWVKSFMDYYSLLYSLRNVKETDYLPSSRKLVQECQSQASAAFQGYHRQYVRAWSQGYEVKAGELAALFRNLSATRSWNEFAMQFDRSRMNQPGSDAGKLQMLLGPALSQGLAATQWLGYNPARQSFLLPDLQNYAPFESPDWKYGRFAVPAVQAPRPAMPRPTDPPWDYIADQIGAVWRQLHQQLVANADVQAGKGDYKAIEWGGLAKARTEFRLEDEAITGGLVELETRARALLDKRLTEILVAIQTEKLGGQVALDGWGWPYLKDEPNRPLLTLGLDKFRGFLSAVGVAKTNLAELEKGLQGTAGYSDRQRFYTQCAAWADFLFGDNGLAKLQPGRTPEPVDLVITSMKWIDPFDPDSGPPPQDYQDTPQHFYRTIRLNLGLTKVANVNDDPEVIPTSVGDRREKRDRYVSGSREVQAVWKWPTAARLFWQYKDGTSLKTDNYPDIEVSLAEGNELALCAYLCRKDMRGRQKGKEFVTEHYSEIKPKKGEVGAVGFRLAFTLDREIPEAIKPLAEVKLAEPAGGQGNVAVKN
jgi:hypothetical protein